MIEVSRCEQRGRKIIIVIEPEFLQGDEVYTSYALKKDILTCVEYAIKIKGFDEPIEAKVDYCTMYTKSHSQINSPSYSLAKTQKDAARLWFGDAELFLDRLAQIKNQFKDDQEFLKEVEDQENKHRAGRKKQKIKEAIEGIKKYMKLLTKEMD